MKGKYYRESRKRKNNQIREFEKQLDNVLLKSHNKGKEYVEWRVNDLCRSFVETNYKYSIAGVEVDLYSFPQTFNVKACRSNTVKQLYFQRTSQRIGRFVIVGMNEEQQKECKKIGLRLVPRKYRIFGKKIKTTA